MVYFIINYSIKMYIFSLDMFFNDSLYIIFTWFTINIFPDQLDFSLNINLEIAHPT